MGPDRSPIAVVGMAALFPGAPDLDAFQRLVWDGREAITDAPADRWDPVFYDPTSTALDRFYGRRGGFVDPWASFDPLRHGVVPSTVAQAEPDQLLVLRLAVDAVRDAGLDLAALPRETTGVYLGRGGYITPGLARSAQKVREGEQVAAVLRQVLPHLSSDEIDAVKQAYRDAAGDLAADQAIGLVPNLAASRTANRLDLHGPAATVDAACASALVAIDHAVSDLRSGRVDAALVGGVHLTHDPTFWSIFCRLGAMSRAGRIRPFDAAADGLLIGEGAGVVLLRRLADAHAAGDRVRAVIRGTGVASDGRAATLMSPSVRGQVLALRRAWSDAGCDPSTVGFVEAHGTATQAGDNAELATLAAVFGGPRADVEPPAVGSVKAQIGHTMPAAGIAGFIKAVLAVEAGQVPPQAGVDTPHAGVAEAGFVVPTARIPWPARPGPRRAGVNAFGFGGINAHVVVEQAPAAPVRPALAAARPSIALYSAASAEALADALRADVRHRDGGPFRFVLRDPSAARRDKAAAIAARGTPWHGRRGMWSAPGGLARTGKVAFLFPGVEEASDDGLAQAADALDVVVPPALREPAAGLDDLGLRGAQIVGAGRVAHAALTRLGAVPDVLAGHSVGEWTALVAAGVIPESELDGFIGSLADETLALPDVAFGAVGAHADAVRAALAVAPGVVLSHDNCPHQAIVCGPEADVRRVLEATGAMSEVLPFRSGFHTPFFAPFAEGFAPHIARVPLSGADRPVWSSCTVAPYPSEPAGVRDVLRRHLVEPVRFRETVEALYGEGVRLFVQLGAGSLPNFVRDTLGERAHATVSTADPRHDALDALAFAACALWAEGVSVDVDALPGVWGPGGRTLPLGAPFVRLCDPPVLSAPAADGPSSLPEGPLGDALRDAFGAVSRAQHEVAAVLSRRAGPQGITPRVAPLGPRRRTWTRRLGVDTDPYLLDHCLFAQPDHVEDARLRHPVVPMTMNIRMMMDAAASLVPERMVVAVEDVRAWHWLVVAPPVEITIEAAFDGHDRVEVSIPGYAEAVVRLGTAWPDAPPARDHALDDPRPLAVPMDEVYPERWMFHGPAYQGLVDLGPTGAHGIVGAVQVPSAPGALLDNVGQVIGFWGFERLPVDGLGFPARIGRIAFFGPEPAVGERLAVTARIDHVGPTSYRGDLDVLHAGRVWARIDGWENRRFETDDVVFPFLRKPGVYGLAEPVADGLFRVRERWRTSASRELLIRRYLDLPHLALYEAVPPWERRAWVLRRVAACDAVRAWLWAAGHGPVYPIDVQVDEDADGGLVVSTPTHRDVRVAVFAADGLAVARVAEGRTPRVGPAELAAVAVPGDNAAPAQETP